MLDGASVPLAESSISGTIPRQMTSPPTAQSTTRRSSSHPPPWGALGILLAAAALRLWNLGGPSLWYDEAYSWWVGIVVSPLESVASSLYELVPPFTYLLWRLWAALTGTSEFALRSSSALAGVLTIAALGAVVRRLTGCRRCTLVALALAAVSPPLLWAAREMRMYGVLQACIGLADWALLQVLFGPARLRRLWGWLWGAMALTALYTVVVSGFWLIGQGCFVAVILLTARRPERRRAVVRALLTPAIVAAVLYLPWLVPAALGLGGNRGFWPGTLTLGPFISRAVRGITVFRFLEPESTALITGILVTLYAIVVPFVSRRDLRIAGYGTLAIVPALAAAYLVYRHLPKWELQHTTVFAPALVTALASAAAPERRWSSRTARAITQSLILGGLLLTTATMARASHALLFSSAHAKDDWRGVADYVEMHRRPGEVVIISTGSVAPAWVYYGGDEGLVRLPDDPLLDVTHVLHYHNTAPLLNATLARAPGVWIIEWLNEVTDPTSIVTTLLEDIGVADPVPVFQGLRLSHYTLPRAPSLPETPPTTDRPDVELLPDVRLWGVTLPVDPQAADEPINIRAWWSVTDPQRHEGCAYQASVRIRDRHDNVWGQSDAPAGAGDHRSEHWPPEMPVLGHYRVALLPGIPSGHYTATVVLYDLNGAYSEEFPLGTFVVGRSKHPPEQPEELVPVTGPDYDAPLKLLGVGLQQHSLAPCEILEGQLFWEIASPVTSPLTVEIGAGDGGSLTLTTMDVVPALWEVGDRYTIRFRLPIDCRASHQRAPLRVTLWQSHPDQDVEAALWDGPQIEIIVERAFAPPEGIIPASLVVSDGLAELVGYRLEPGSLSGHEPLRIVLYWQAGALTDTPYTAFVHIVPRGEPSPLIAQHDAWPAEGSKPTYTWVIGEIVTDPHPLPALPAGAYDVRIGFYDPDLTRLPLTAGDTRVPDDVFVLTTLAVE